MYQVRLITVLFFLLNIAVSIHAQYAFEAEKLTDKQLQINITIEKGYTLFGLSHATGVEIEQILSVNDHLNQALSLGKLIILPINPEKVLGSPDDVFNPVPLYYTVQQGENLFQISRTTNRTVSELMSLNNKTSSTLALNEVLLVGYINWPYYLSDPIVQVKTNVTVLQGTMPSLSPLEATFDITPPALVGQTTIASTRVREKGIAYWEKTSDSYSDLIVMHPTARINSKISLYNPMLKRTVTAKVVGELPKEAYPEDISVVISSSVANALGALDKRFLVEITYVE